MLIICASRELMVDLAVGLSARLYLHHRATIYTNSTFLEAPFNKRLRATVNMNFYEKLIWILLREKNEILSSVIVFHEKSQILLRTALQEKRVISEKHFIVLFCGFCPHALLTVKYKVIRVGFLKLGSTYGCLGFVSILWGMPSSLRSWKRCRNSLYGTSLLVGSTLHRARKSAKWSKSSFNPNLSKTSRK